MFIAFKHRHDICGFGLILGTLLFTASLTPSLVPRAPWIQGLLGGFCLAAGYGIGVALRRFWRFLELPALHGRRQDLTLAWTLTACAAAAALALIWARHWQNDLRLLMGMPPADGSAALTVAVLALLTFVALLGLARLFNRVRRLIFERLSRHLARTQAAALAILTAALLFWSIGNDLLGYGALLLADRIFGSLDALIEDDIARPTDPDKTGSPASLIAWDQLGREGRRMIAAGPDAAAIARMKRETAPVSPVSPVSPLAPIDPVREADLAFDSTVLREPLRVYVGLNFAEGPPQRAALALRELQRIGAFDRAHLVIATPTGTGWIDPESQSALEYLFTGDVATVAVQYSYLKSWLALLADPDYGVATARAVFAAVYDHWRSLPRGQRPRLWLNGLSLGALNGDQSHDLYQVISDPYDGALWAGPPFNTPTWRAVTSRRDAGSPAWLPRFGGGAVVRFTSQSNHLGTPPAPWGPYRIAFLQYASDAVTFFEPGSLWRRPEWMAAPLGPDVSRDITWIPVVTFLQLAFDLMIAVEPPIGHGHTYAFDHYVDAWAELAEPAGWTPERLASLKRSVAELRRRPPHTF